jgi:hypothetical protein
MFIRSFVGVLVASLALAGCSEEPAPASGGAATAKPTSSSAPKANASAVATASAAATTASSYACASVKEESLCREYGSKNIEAAGVDFLKGICQGRGEWKEGTCPADKRVGSCATPEGTKVYYGDGPIPFNAASAEKACKEGVPAGEWKAGG